MTIFEFIITMTVLGMCSIGFLLAYKDLKKQVKRLQKEIEEAEQNKRNEE